MLEEFKEPWPEIGIYNYDRIEDGRWGYLILENNKFRFDCSETPSDEEITKRWGPYLKRISSHEKK